MSKNRRPMGQISAAQTSNEPLPSSSLRQQSWVDKPSVPVCTSQQRLNYIRQQFRKYNVTSQSPKALLLNDEKQLAYCGIAKIASSTMKRFLASLTGKVNPVELRQNHVYPAARLRRYGLRFVNITDVQSIAHYRKTVVIRNPMDRFLSAYHDKFIHSKRNFRRDRVDQIMQRHNVTTGSQFQRFVKAVLLGYEDYHWTPYANRCGFPTVDYDDVIRIETFRNDVMPLLDYTQADMSSLFNLSEYHYRRSSTRAGDSVYHARVKPKYLHDYSEIPTDDLMKLRRIYEDDLRLLGYEFDVDTLVASCSMTDERGVTCC